MVKADYWNLFSFNPALKAEGKNPFTLARKFPDRAKGLFARAKKPPKSVSSTWRSWWSCTSRRPKGAHCRRRFLAEPPLGVFRGGRDGKDRSDGWEGFEGFENVGGWA